METYKHFEVSVENHIAHVAFNRPEKANALNHQGWVEMQAIFETLDEDPEVRVIILSGNGRHFCSGIDLGLLMELQGYQSMKCEGRKREKLRKFILMLQGSISSIEACRKPVIAAIHSGCIGGGVDITSACDMRFCTEDAYFTIKEIDMGLVADIGTLQRLPKILSPGLVAELAYTGRKWGAEESLKNGWVNHHFPTREEMMAGVEELAGTIASKSPLVTRGIKEMLLYTRDHTVAESLNYVATWNAAMLFSEDLMEAFQASIQKRKAEFSN